MGRLQGFSLRAGGSGCHFQGLEVQLLGFRMSGFHFQGCRVLRDFLSSGFQFQGSEQIFQVIETLLKDSWNLYQRHVLLGSACLLSCE